MYTPQRTTSAADGLRLGIAVSRYHEAITQALRDGAIGAFMQAGGSRDDLIVTETPGAFELTAVCRALARRTDIDGVVAIGCVITGETTHDQFIVNSVVQGVTRLVVQIGKPIGFGVLTCQTIEQARARAGGEKGNKGAEAMTAVLETIHAMREIESAEPIAVADAGGTL